mgnify:CR=1 FL=1
MVKDKGNGSTNVPTINAQERSVKKYFGGGAVRGEDVEIGIPDMGNAARWGVGEMLSGANIGQYKKGGKVK